MMKTSIAKFISIFLLIMLFLVYLAGVRPLVVMSGSMEPNLPTGSLCFLDSKAEMEDIETNDVITYSLLDSYITHRAVNISEAGIETKGDANNVKDIGIVTDDNFEGKILGHVPYLGYVLFFIKKHLEVAIVLIVLTLIPYGEIFKGRRSGSNEKETICDCNDNDGSISKYD